MPPLKVQSRDSEIPRIPLVCPPLDGLNLLFLQTGQGQMLCGSQEQFLITTGRPSPSRVWPHLIWGWGWGTLSLSLSLICCSLSRTCWWATGTAMKGRPSIPATSTIYKQPHPVELSGLQYLGISAQKDVC